MAGEPPQNNIIGAENLIRSAHRFSHNAMGTIFEIFALCEDASYAWQAARAAFDELDRLEQQLSRFVETSDVSRINNMPAGQSLRIDQAVFECLHLSVLMYAQTGGAFDVTLGSAVMGNQLRLDEVQYTVQQPDRAVKVDLGGIGKGYAVDRMGGLLRDWEIDIAMIHGGHSSVLALGSPAGTKGWPVKLSNPENHKEQLATLYLQRRALGGSDLQRGRHIIDPHTAMPVEGKIAAWACASGGAVADALSTAFMVMSPQQIEQYCMNHSDVSAMIIIEEGRGKERKVLRYGTWFSQIVVD